MGSSSPLASLPVELVGSFPDPAHPLSPSGPEIAFLGRSNVGKSSLLNALVGRKALARVSGTPGKTQLMNVYRLPSEGCYFIDLPGYGYAKASKPRRVGFRQLIEGYLRHRTDLVGVVWLLDIRHAPSQEDLALHHILVAVGCPTLVVLTKADKLPLARRKEAVRSRASELGVQEESVLAVSSTKGIGIRDLAESVLEAIHSAA